MAVKKEKWEQTKNCGLNQSLTKDILIYESLQIIIV